MFTPQKVDMSQAVRTCGAGGDGVGDVAPTFFPVISQELNLTFPLKRIESEFGKEDE